MIDKKAFEAAVDEMKDTSKWLGVFIGFIVGIGLIGFLLIGFGVFLMKMFGFGIGFAGLVGTIILGGIVISGVAKYFEVKRRGC